MLAIILSFLVSSFNNIGKDDLDESIQIFVLLCYTINELNCILNNFGENLKEEYNYYVPEILYLCKSKKIYGKKNKTSIKSIFESPDYPKVKNDRSSK